MGAPLIVLSGVIVYESKISGPWRKDDHDAPAYGVGDIPRERKVLFRKVALRTSTSQTPLENCGTHASVPTRLCSNVTLVTLSSRASLFPKFGVSRANRFARRTT